MCGIECGTEVISSVKSIGYGRTICQLCAGSCNRPPNAMLCACVCPGKCQLCYGSCKNITGSSGDDGVRFARSKPNNNINHDVASYSDGGAFGCVSSETSRSNSQHKQQVPRVTRVPKQ